jgi:hypothetical protein
MNTKQVSFATYSELRVYHLDAKLESRKCYSSRDRKSFQAQALCDAFRIQRLMGSSPYHGGHAVRYLIERDMMAPEELLGIENMIMGAQKITEERRKHAKYVIKAQEELRKTKADNAEAKLAYVAAAKSAKAFEKARLRAALAA